jgi:hypothetical protein
VEPSTTGVKPPSNVKRAATNVRDGTKSFQ